MTIEPRYFDARDGVRLAWRETCPEAGDARPLILLHGLFSSGEVNWIKFGHAALLAEAGFEAIMPDLRAHGESEAPHDPAAYGVATIDLTLHYVAVGTGDLIATAHCERRGRSISFARGEVRAEDGTLVALATGTFKLVARQPARG